MAPGGSTTFDVTFDPIAAGTRTAAIWIENNDDNERPTTLISRVTGTTAVPEIDLRFNGISIADGDMTPSTADGTIFDSQNVASGSVTRTFTIVNTGSGTLNLTGSPLVQIIGSNPGDFLVTAQPNTNTLAPGGTTTFNVTFDPTAAGTRTAAIWIENNDDNEAP